MRSTHYNQLRRIVRDIIRESGYDSVMNDAIEEVRAFVDDDLYILLVNINMLADKVAAENARLDITYAVDIALGVSCFKDASACFNLGELKRLKDVLDELRATIEDYIDDIEPGDYRDMMGIMRDARMTM